MNAVWKLGAAVAAVLLVTGCADHTGKWVLDTIDPPDARGQYQFANITLNKDGTYWAEREVGGKMEKNTGTYTFENGTLAFKNAAGKTITYDAQMMDMNNKMKVMAETHGKKVTAVMKRG